MFISVCASSLYLGQPLETTMAKLREAGAKHYEFWTWWDQDLDAVVREQEAAGLKPMLVCTKFVPLTDANQIDAYMEGLHETVEACKKIGCNTIITQVGADLEEQGISREEQHKNIVSGLKRAGAYLKEVGLDIVFEPLNLKVDHPGYYLYAAEEAYEIAQEVGMDNVKILFDIYHQHITEGIDIQSVIDHIGMIGHFHVAGYPGRHEPLTPNEINYPEIMAAIAKAGYDKGVGLEYFPAEGPEALAYTLKELDRYNQ